MGVYTLLTWILNMSVTASVTILIVLLARFLLKGAPKIFSYVLWLVVLFRLLCPITVTSPMSLLRIFDGAATEKGNMEYIPVDIVYANEEAVAPHEEKTLAAGAGETAGPKRNTERTAENAVKAYVAAAGYVWICGVALMLLYGGISLLRLRKKLVGAVRVRKRIYEADEVVSPFVIGIFRPRIYLPATIQDKELDYILLHERTHIRRGDHIVKAIFYLAVVLHWFNPLVWLAFWLMEKDMEMSCDETVMRHMDSDIRAEYSESLLGLATGKNRIAGAPLAFGEGDTRERIKNVMHYRKPAIGVVVIAIMVVVMLMAALGSNPGDERTDGAQIEPANSGIVGVAGTEQEEETGLEAEWDALQEEKQNLKAEQDALQENMLSLKAEQEILQEEVLKLRLEQAGLQEKLSENANFEDVGDMSESATQAGEAAHQFVENWAKAFCDRDGDAIVSMSSEGAQSSLQERGLLEVGGNYVDFGMSSPWPWDSGKDYKIVSLTETYAEIVYYAWTSDPHVTEWRERLMFHLEDGKGLADKENLEYLDAICVKDEYGKAYANGITGGMDYLTNGAGASLNDNALRNRNNSFYEKLFEPESAAVCLLNLLDNPNKVEVSADSAKEDGSVAVTVHFVEDGNSVTVSMIQPYGEDGIWIPCTM